MVQGKRIVVIGACIVGASLAYHLAGKGANVTVVDAGDVASGVTATSFAWINTTHDAPDPIASLRTAAIHEYHRLEQELPSVNVRWTGALCYDTNTQPAMTLRVTRERIRELEPQLKKPPEHAQFKAQEGALDAVHTTQALITGAQAHGAKLLTHTPVLGFKTQGSKVTGIETRLGTINADLVVLAAGTGTPALTKQLGFPLPIDASPAIFIRYSAPSGIVRTLISNPAMEVRESAEGAWLAAEDYLDDAPHNQRPLLPCAPPAPLQMSSKASRLSSRNWPASGSGPCRQMAFPSLASCRAPERCVCLRDASWGNAGGHRRAAGQ